MQLGFVIVISALACCLQYTSCYLSSGRRWWIAGEFSSVVNSTNSFPSTLTIGNTCTISSCVKRKTYYECLNTYDNSTADCTCAGTDITCIIAGNIIAIGTTTDLSMKCNSPCSVRNCTGAICTDNTGSLASCVASPTGAKCNINGTYATCAVTDASLIGTTQCTVYNCTTAGLCINSFDSTVVNCSCNGASTICTINGSPTTCAVTNTSKICNSCTVSNCVKDTCYNQAEKTTNNCTCIGALTTCSLSSGELSKCSVMDSSLTNCTSCPTSLSAETIANATVPVNNVAYFDGNYWRSMGNGTNGPVHQIVFDYCLNVFIVGNFTHAGGVKTGPLAVWRPFSTNWEPVGNFMNASFNGVINTVTSDCWDVRSSFVQCTCDLYIGGQFTLAIDENKTDIAVNVASYSFVSKQWSSMGGSSSHGMSTRDSVVCNFSN